MVRNDSPLALEVQQFLIFANLTECQAMARAIATGDHCEVGRVFSKAFDRYQSEPSIFERKQAGG